MAVNAHAGQTRKFDGSSYIGHLKEVFDLLAYAGVEEEDIFIAGILHDTLEDTTLTEADIRVRFGNGVSILVKSLSDDKSLRLEKRKSRSIKNVKELSSGALTIMLADLISNLSAIPRIWDEQKIKFYLKHCMSILEAAGKNSQPSIALKKLFKMANFFLSAQKEGSSEYSHLCELAKDGRLFWCDEGHYFVVADHLEGSNEVSKLLCSMLEDAFYLGLLRGISTCTEETKLMSITWEQVLESDEPLIYGTSQEVHCQRVILKS